MSTATQGFSFSLQIVLKLKVSVLALNIELTAQCVWKKYLIWYFWSYVTENCTFN